MTRNAEPVPVWLGLRSKTGRAIAVAVVAVPGGPPRGVARDQLSLSDPARAITVAPYHALTQVPWPEAEAAIAPARSAIEALAEGALAAFVGSLGDRGLRTVGAGVVGAPSRDLGRIGSAHVRAHAAEGVLFRAVLETALRRTGLPFRSFSERTVEAEARAALSLDPEALRGLLAELGRPLGSPWRADEKAAALAAWLASMDIDAPSPRS